nr:hypothetical protein [Paludibacterium denitrificans]
MGDRLFIFDTTLRDGEQSPGAAMTKEEKIRIARQLERLGVDIIEAGFAAASPGDADAIRTIAGVVKNSTICSLARANERDIRAAGEAISPAARGRIHTFIATSPIHMEKKLRMSPEQVVEAAVKAVKFAREFTDDVEFSAEDALRSELSIPQADFCRGDQGRCYHDQRAGYRRLLLAASDRSVLPRFDYSYGGWRSGDLVGALPQ